MVYIIKENKGTKKMKKTTANKIKKQITNLIETLEAAATEAYRDNDNCVLGSLNHYVEQLEEIAESDDGDCGLIPFMNSLTGKK